MPIECRENRTAEGIQGKHNGAIQRRFDIGPASATLAQYQTSVGLTSGVSGGHSPEASGYLGCGGKTCKCRQA